MKAYEKIGILLHQSHCSVVPKNTALLFPNLLHFILPKSLYFIFLFTGGIISTHFFSQNIPFSSKTWPKTGAPHKKNTYGFP
jgi:hypothetical protein